ncbi:MAG: LuxR C-terminal-related transcriptional regulator [Rhodococcus sp. (in: high G+C Gram-positive bacteria)]|uniref:LuxR C-terminal-related transcriptional regulator n=1 Tax=Rhodococcus sp. TaxID=1831 RepID=UPI003BB6767E
MTSLVTPPSCSDSPRSPSLSSREKQVLTLWLVCDSKHDVAQQLFITVATVQTHLMRIRIKYEAANRPAGNKIALLIRALEDGYCTLDEIARSTDRLRSA